MNLFTEYYSEHIQRKPPVTTPAKPKLRSVTAELLTKKTAEVSQTEIPNTATKKTASNKVIGCEETVYTTSWQHFFSKSLQYQHVPRRFMYGFKVSMHIPDETGEE